MDAWRKHRAPTSAELLAENLGTAYACGMLNANLLATTPLRLFVTTGRGEAQSKMGKRGEADAVDKKTLARLKKNPPAGSRVREAVRVEEVLSHPLLTLLNRPTPMADGVGLSLFELFNFTQLYQEVIGRAYWKVDRDGIRGTPTAVWILAAHQVREICDPSSERIIDYYEFGGGTGGGSTKYDPSEVVPFRMPDLRNPYTGGMSPLRSVIEQVRIVRKTDAHTGALLDNQARPDALFIPKGSAEGYDIGAIPAARLEARINQRFRMAGRGGIMVAEHDGQIHPLQWPTRDIVELEQCKLAKTQVANAYDVPTSKLDRNDANRAGAETGDYAHAKDAGVPRCKRNEAALNAFFIPMWDPTGRLFLAYEDPVPQNREADREDRKLLVAAGAVVRNELRADAGMESRPDMEAPLVPKDMVGVDEEGNPLPPTPVSPINLNMPGGPGADPKASIDPKSPDQLAQDVNVHEDAVLNGAQVTAATAIVTAVAAGDIPRDSGIGQLQVLFNLKPDQAEEIMGSAGKADVATTPNPKPAGAEQDGQEGGTNNPSDPAQPQPGTTDKGDKKKGKKGLVGNIGDDGLAGPLPQGKRIAAALKRVFADQRAAVLKDLEGKGIEDIETKLIDALASHGKAIESPAALHAFTRVMSVARRKNEQPKEDAAADPLAGLPTRFIDLSDWNQAIADAVRPMIEIIATKGAEKTISRVGASKDVFSVVEKKIPQAVQDLSLKFAASTNETTSLQLNDAISKLRDELTAGLVEGDTRVEMKSRVAAVFDQASDSRAAMIAKTEASRAQHAGEILGAKASGVVTKKKWLLSADACPVCEAIEAAFPDGVDLDGSFGSTAFGPITSPPAHPNCACSETFEVDASDE